MGIQGLIPFLKKSTKAAHISQFSGKCVAVDAYCWLHKGAYSCVEKLARGEACDAYVTYCMKFVNMLLAYNIKPILVFDGRHLPAKAKTELKRRESRELNRARAAELLRAGRTDEARNFMRRSIDISHDMALALIRECRRRNVDCIVAPYEADAQLAYFNLKNIAHVIITEDSDLVLFGCNMVMFKLDLNGNGLVVEKEKLFLAMGIRPENFDFEKFMYMCILSGCDYLPSLPGIGLAKALKFVTKTADPDIHRALSRLPSHLNMHGLSVSKEYRDEFLQAVATFKYQLVYDPITRKLVPLNETPSEYEHDNYVGEMLPEDVAYQLALGNLDPFTLKRVDNFDPDSAYEINCANSKTWKQSAVAAHASIWNRSYESPNCQKEVIARKEVKTKRKVFNLALDDFEKNLHTTEEIISLYCEDTKLEPLNVKNSIDEKVKGIIDELQVGPECKKFCMEKDDHKENLLTSPSTFKSVNDPQSPILSSKKYRNPFAISSGSERNMKISPRKKTSESVISEHKPNTAKQFNLFKAKLDANTPVIRSRYFLTNKTDGKWQETTEKKLLSVASSAGSLSTSGPESTEDDSLKKDEVSRIKVEEENNESNGLLQLTQKKTALFYGLEIEDTLDLVKDNVINNSKDNSSVSLSCAEKSPDLIGNSDSNSDRNAEMEEIGCLSGKLELDAICDDSNKIDKLGKAEILSAFSWKKVNIAVEESATDISRSEKSTYRNPFKKPTLISSDVTEEDINCTEKLITDAGEQYSKENHELYHLQESPYFKKESPVTLSLSSKFGGCRKQGLNRKSFSKHKSLQQQNILSMFASQKKKQLGNGLT